jgi:membrane associated rhomboid family serine protease
MLGYDDHVERIWRSSLVGGAINVIRYEGTALPSLLDLSHFLTGSGDSGKILRETAGDVGVPWDESGWNLQQLTKQAHPPRAIVDYGNKVATKSISGASSSKTSYGFRRNDKKAQRLASSPQAPFHVTTGLLLVGNLAMFFWLWNSRIDPSQVALNGQIYHDLGRAFTGSISHFEIWHLAVNMMTLSNLGPILEQKYGSLPFLLWTLSFLPILTLVVVGLHHLHRRFLASRQSTINFPSMVGFSGVLFVWMVVATLDGQRSCPIVFFPSLCFDTWELAGIGRVSLGPLVQLVFLQFVLPRVSFLGHLSGVVVGFLWHWNLFPPLDWFQPCILFPLLWIVGKYLVGDWNFGALTQQSANSPWARSGGNTSIGELPSFKALSSLFIVLLCHFLVQLLQEGFIIKATTTISEFFLLAIFFRMIRIERQSQQKDDSRKQWFGIMGRGYVTLAGILLVTDGLTLGGWIATWSLWSHATITDLSLIITRDILVILSISTTVHTLNAIGETSTAGGTWSLLIWPWTSRLPVPLTGKESWTPNLESYPCCRRQNRENLGTYCQLPVESDASESTELV